MCKLWYIDSNGKRKRTQEGLRHEHEVFQSSPEAKKANSSRVSARKKAIRSGRVHRGDGKELDHKNSNPLDNSPSNIRVLSRKANRSKRENSRKRGSRRKKWKQK